MIKELEDSALREMQRRFEAYRNELPMTLKESLKLIHKVKRWKYLSPDIMAAVIPGNVPAIWAGNGEADGPWCLFVWPEWLELPLHVKKDTVLPERPEQPVVEPESPSDNPDNYDSFGKWMGNDYCDRDKPEPPEYAEEEAPTMLLNIHTILFRRALREGAFNVVTIK